MYSSCHTSQDANYMYKKCKAQAEYHYAEYIKFLSYAKYYKQLRQNRVDELSSQHSTQCYTSCGDHISKGSSSNKRTKKKRRKRPTAVKSSPSNNHNFEHYSQDDEGELEVDPGFKEFLKKSAEFRKARDAEKLRANNDHGDRDEGSNENVEYVDVMRKGPEGTTLPPTAVNRKQLYEQRYGETLGVTVLSLETALQWKFNKFLDSKAPKPWPAMPIKL